MNVLTKRILVVDDEAEVLISLSKILKRANYDVTVTAKGKDAINLAKNIQPDLIILDIIMPDLPGDEVAAQLLEDPATAKIPIIFLTAILTKKEEALTRKTDRYYVIAKPTTGIEVIGLIEKILSTPPHPSSI